MQRKLATWAAADPARRIERLLLLITQPDWQLSYKYSGMNFSLVTINLCQPDGYTSLKATANCDRWGSPRCGIVLFSGQC